jgi:hypothetical protein
MSWILSGYHHGDAGPVLLLDRTESGRPIRREFSLRGAQFSLSWGTDRRCIGHYDLIDGGSFPCPDSARLEGDLTTCAKCFRLNGFNPSFYNVEVATLSRQQRIYNERPHVVYLAAFSPQCMKVGIASHARVHARWRDQGARLALELARCADAYEARAHEERISRELALPEQVRGAKKRALLNEFFDAPRARLQLERARVTAETTLGLAPLALPVHDLHAAYLGARALELPLVDLTDAVPAAISGVGLGMVGDILVVEHGTRQFMLALKGLVGRVIELSDTLRPNATRSEPGQMGFGF